MISSPVGQPLQMGAIFRPSVRNKAKESSFACVPTFTARPASPAFNRLSEAESSDLNNAVQRRTASKSTDESGACLHPITKRNHIFTKAAAPKAVPEISASKTNKLLFLAKSSNRVYRHCAAIALRSSICRSSSSQPGTQNKMR